MDMKTKIADLTVDEFIELMSQINERVTKVRFKKHKVIEMVLDILKEKPEGKNIYQLSKMVNYNYPNLTRIIKSLSDIGVIKFEKKKNEYNVEYYNCTFVRDITPVELNVLGDKNKSFVKKDSIDEDYDETEM